MSSSANIASDRKSSSPGGGAVRGGGGRRSSGGMYVPGRHDELSSGGGSGGGGGGAHDRDQSAGGDHDDDESTLAPAANHNEAPARMPLDTALRQQRMRSWQPILDPTYVVAALFVLGVVFLATGLVVDRNSRDLVEVKVKYDSYHDNSTVCYNITPNENRTCLLSFTAPRDMPPPVLIHYEIENFYQNHRRYVKSRDDVQLRGDPNGHQLGQERCDPLRQLGNQTLNPCGLIANTLFNDVISLRSGNDDAGEPLNMSETGIAWESDLQYKFWQVDGFRHEQCTSCADCACDGVEWTCNTTDNSPYEVDGVCYRYYYPNEAATRYLYETYPMVVSPLDGVTNEHFVVWMRTAALPTFRKLYGWINQPISQGEVLTFEVLANWEVQSFRGSKSLLLSTNNAFGGKNNYLGRFFWILGVVFLGLATLFGAKIIFRPRKLGDRRYLKYKED